MTPLVLPGPVNPVVLVPVAPPVAAPITAKVECKGDLKKAFGGFAIKGGEFVEISEVVAEYPNVGVKMRFAKNSQLSYTGGKLAASSGIASQTEEKVQLSLFGVPECNAEVSVKLLPDDSFVLAGALERGLKGLLFALTPQHKKLPDFSKLASLGDVFITNIDLPNRSFEEGFPGVRSSLKEWFAIDFRGGVYG